MLGSSAFLRFCIHRRTTAPATTAPATQPHIGTPATFPVHDDAPPPPSDGAGREPEPVGSAICGASHAAPGGDYLRLIHLTLSTLAGLECVLDVDVHGSQRGYRQLVIGEYRRRKLFLVLWFVVFEIDRRKPQLWRVQGREHAVCCLRRRAFPRW